MAKETDSLDLTDRQKTRLLDLALDPPGPPEPGNENEQRGDLLHDILRCCLPLRAGTCASVTASSQGLRSVVGSPIGELLQDPKTAVAVLKEIKQYAKTQGGQAVTEREKDVFLAIYFAAIAAALTHYRALITEHSGEDLTQFLRNFAHAAWITNDLVDLFRKAIRACSEAKTCDRV